jgi:glycine/serine hydroxymethyltransferase
MGPGEMQAIAGLIGRTLRARTDETAVTAVRGEVAALCAAFPPYPGLLKQ